MARLLALVAVLCGGAAFAISQRMRPVYQASTTVLINEAPATKSADYASALTSVNMTQTYAQMLTKQPVVEGVIQRLGLSKSVEEVKAAIQVQPVRDTQLIEVRVEDTNPQQAADIANALVTEFADQNHAMQSLRYAASKQSLETQIAQLDQQIQASNQALAALSHGSDQQAERDRLQANQAQYQQTKAYLLQSYEQILSAEA